MEIRVARLERDNVVTIKALQIINQKIKNQKMALIVIGIAVIFLALMVGVK